MVNIIRAGYRLFMFICVLTFFILRLLVVGMFKGLTLDLGLRHRQQCCHAMMYVLNVAVTIKGNIHHGSYLFISNHRCYLDPVAQLTAITALPVAKAEVGNLPIMGFGARITGVHYVKRESLKSRKETRSSIAETIESGRSILIYPEGTTFKAPTLAEFKPGTFKMAATNKVDIIPIAIEYGDQGDAWVGPESMPIHFLKAFGKKQNRITVHFGEPMWMDDGVALKEKVRDWIKQELINIRTDWGMQLD